MATLHDGKRTYKSALRRRPIFRAAKRATINNIIYIYKDYSHIYLEYVWTIILHYFFIIPNPLE